MKKFLIFFLPLLLAFCMPPSTVKLYHFFENENYGVLKKTNYAFYGTREIDLNAFIGVFNDAYFSNRDLYKTLKSMLNSRLREDMKGSRIVGGKNTLPSSNREDLSGNPNLMAYLQNVGANHVLAVDSIIIGTNSELGIKGLNIPVYEGPGLPVQSTAGADVVVRIRFEIFEANTGKLILAFSTESAAKPDHWESLESLKYAFEKCFENAVIFLRAEGYPDKETDKIIMIKSY